MTHGTSVIHVLPGFGYFPDDPGNAPMSGITYVAFQIGRQQARSGWNVSLATYSDGADRYAFDADGVSIRRVHPRPALALPRFDFSYTLPLLLAERSRRYGVAHVHSNPYNLFAVRSSSRVLHFHTGDFRPSASYRRAVARADALVFCSDALRRRFDDIVGPEPAVPRHVVYNGTDPERFRDREADGQAFRERLGIHPDEVVVLFAGTIHWEKGLDVLIDAIHRARDLTSTRLRLVVVGSSTIWRQAGRPVGISDYERSLVATADPALVCWAGALPQREMPAAFAAADFTACPSVYPEPFPVVNVEAMAAGRPVIGSRAGGIPELVVDGMTGLIVEQRDPEALARSIVALAENPAARRELGDNARRRVAAMTWDRIVGQINDLYDGVAGSRGSHRAA